MRALKIVAPRSAELQDVPEPVTAPGTVKIAVAYAGICGSDLGIYEYAPFPADYRHPIFDESGPFTLGHEFSGHVLEVGESVTGVAVGDLVTVRPNVWDGTCAACLRGETNLCENGGFVGIQGGGGGFSEIVVTPASQVHVLPPMFTPQLGAMVESTAVAWHAARVAGVSPGSTVLILGAGPVGLGILLTSLARGAQRVIVSELSDSRKRLAAELGADVVDPRETDVAKYLREVTGGAGADAAFDASGAGDATFGAALSGLRTGGTAVIVASFHGAVSLDPNVLMSTEKKLTGSYAYTDTDFVEVIEAIAEGRLDPSPLISSTIALADATQKGLDYLLGEGRNSEVKILVSP
jgi:(R,R)-butanediol dehydrogenase/meso-butanediol dehydrogenase/diacetyl reductase